MAGKIPKIGILALQGDFNLHEQTLVKLGIAPRLIKMPDQLIGVDGLIIPGGESTALLRLCKPIGMLDAITSFAKSGGHIFGTCAGAILLAQKVENPAQESIGLIGITIERNGYGRQLDSIETIGQMYLPLGNSEVPLTLIRAPRIVKVSKQVKILIDYGNSPVLVRQGKILAATFHPELNEGTKIISFWLHTF